MKIKRLSIFSTVFLLILSLNTYSQSSIIIVADSTNSMDSDIAGIYPDANYGDLHRFRADAWTYSGAQSIVRAALYFDLSMFCPNTQILEARLNLYHDDDFDNSTLSGSNACYLKRIVQKWAEDSITWNTQPEVTDFNQVILKSSDSVNQDYLNIDVTNLIQDMVSNQDSSFGFLLQLNEESQYRRMNFASSEHEDYLKHPRLTILFDSCFIGCINTVTIYDTLTIFDSISVTDTLIIDVEITASPDYTINEIKVFPNPTKDILYIYNGDFTNLSNYTVKIINSNSQVVYESEIDQELMQVNISDFGSTGLYLIQVFDNNSNLINTKKILLE